MNNSLFLRYGTGLIIALFCIAVFCFSRNFIAVKNADHPDLIASSRLKAESMLNTNPRDAFSYFDSVFNKITTPGPGDLYSKYDFLRDYNFEHTRNYPMALLYVDSMIRVLQPYANDRAYNRLYAEAYLYKGDILFKQKRFDEAYLSFYEGKINIRPFGSACDYATFQFNFHTRLSDISYGQGRYKAAAGWSKKAIAFLSYCGNDFHHVFMIQGVYDNIALSYTHAGMVDSALYFYDKALALTQSAHPADSIDIINFAVARGVILGNQGTVYFNEGKFALAEQKFIQSIAINGRKGYATQDALITRMKLAGLYFKTGQLNKTGILLQEIDASVDTMPGEKDKLQLMMLKASYNNATGHATDAYKQLQQYIRLGNAFKNEDKNLMATDFNKEFELFRRRYDVQSLERQNQVKNLYLIAALLIFIMAVAIIYLVLKSNRHARENVRQSARHNKQLEIALDALEKSNKENEQLLGVVAHDLKNPINAIYGISEIMMDENGRTAEDLEMLNLVKVSSKNLDTIIHDVLAARLNHTGSDMKKAVVNVRELLQESVSLLQYRAAEKKQQIICEAAGNCQATVNRDRIWRVVNNLLVNAIKFSGEHTTIHVNCAQAGGEVVVSVKDHGIGIPLPLQEKIFQLANETKRQGTSGEETFGLGLYISRQIIEEQGGRIWLDSCEGQGATFYFSLPVG